MKAISNGEKTNKAPVSTLVMAPGSLIEHIQSYCVEKELASRQGNCSTSLSMACLMAVWVAGGLVDLVSNGSHDDLSMFCKMLQEMKVKETMYDKLQCIRTPRGWHYNEKGHLVKKAKGATGCSKS